MNMITAQDRKAAKSATSLAARLDQLADLLVEQGHCDARTVDRGRRVAAESGQRLDKVLLQLGLVSERGLAQAYATLLGLPLATPDRYPPDEPLLPERLGARFLRAARAVPAAREDGRLLRRDHRGSVVRRGAAAPHGARGGHVGVGSVTVAGRRAPAPPARTRRRPPPPAPRRRPIELLDAVAEDQQPRGEQDDLP